MSAWACMSSKITYVLPRIQHEHAASPMLRRLFGAHKVLAHKQHTEVGWQLAAVQKLKGGLMQHDLATVCTRFHELGCGQQRAAIQCAASVLLVPAGMSHGAERDKKHCRCSIQGNNAVAHEERQRSPCAAVCTRKIDSCMHGAYPMSDVLSTPDATPQRMRRPAHTNTRSSSTAGLCVSA